MITIHNHKLELLFVFVKYRIMLMYGEWWISNLGHDVWVKERFQDELASLRIHDQIKEEQKRL